MERADGSRRCTVAEICQSAEALKINDRSGLGFYTLRHNFQTIGGDAKDAEAVVAIMRHVDSSMGAHYRERISDERLKAATGTVQSWLFPPEEDTTKAVTSD